MTTVNNRLTTLGLYRYLLEHISSSQDDEVLEIRVSEDVKADESLA